MTGFLGDFPEDFTTVTCIFTTHAADGSPVAPNSAFEAADVVIFKNGSATEKTSTNGVTMTSPFNGTTGLHCVAIDTSNDTGDSGFWTAGGGGLYTLVLVPDETVAGLAVTRVIGQFGISLLKPATAANLALVQADTDDIQTRLPAALVSGRMSSDAVAISGDTSCADRLEALTDTWATGTLPSQSGVAAGKVALSNGVITFDTQWNGAILIITTGSGAGYFDVVSDTVASTDLLTLGAPGVALPVTLDNTSTFLMITIPGLSAEATSAMVNAIWDEPTASHVTAGTFGAGAPADVTKWNGTAVASPNTAGVPLVDIGRISGDATAADNAESFFDGTGYDGTNNIIPQVTTVTGDVLGFTGGMTTGGMARLFTADSGTSYAAAVDGSVVKEIVDNGAATVVSQEAIADVILGRNIAGGSNGGRTVTDALRPLRNRWTVAGGTYTSYEEDDVTVAWTGSVSSVAGAAPLTGNDPA